MARANRREHRSPRRERGIAMVAIVSLLALIGAYMIANGLNRTNAELLGEREIRSMDALRQAKAALIAYAASEQWQLFKTPGTYFQPGALPCPDIVHDGTESEEGDADCILPLTSSLIGRIPWKTLGIEDLRDATGEKLWYAVSANFRKSTTNVINTNSKGKLTVTGTAPANEVIAIVFAPGAALQGQSRSAAVTDSAYSDPANYLEGLDVSDPVNYVFTSSALPSATHNDRLLAITHADLFSMVEPVVAALVERDVKPQLNTYSTEWSYDASWNRTAGISNVFPYPATFANPDPGTSATRPQSAYLGNTVETSGLLPITASASYSWTAGSGSVGRISGTADVSGVTCISVTSPVSGWQCTFTVSGSGVFLIINNPRFRVEGRIGANAGISFPALPSTSLVTANVGGSPITLLSPAIKGRLTSAAVGTVAYEGTYSAVCFACAPRVLQITIPDLAASKLTNASQGVNPAYWFIANEWYRETYYSVSPGYLPGAGASCSPSGSPYYCLTVNKLPASYAVLNDKRAILVIAGRSFSGAARPSPSLANYLEGENTTPGDWIFEHRAGALTPINAGALTPINDRVVVVSP